MKLLKKIYLICLLIAVLVIGVVMLVRFGPLSSLMNEKPEEGSKWVYVDYTFDSEATEGAGLSIAKASAADVATGYKNTVLDFTDYPDYREVTYYDTLTFKDGKIIRTHNERKTSTIDGQDIYTHVEEVAMDYGTYSGKKITVDNEKFEEAYIRDGILYVYIKTYSSTETVAILRFKPAE